MTEEMSEAYNDVGNQGRLNGLQNIDSMTLLKVFVTIVAVSGTSVTLVGIGSQPALAASISASDVSVTTNDGNLSAVTINPNVTVIWNGLDGQVNRIDMNLRVSNQSDQRVLKTPYIENDFRCDTTSHPDCGKSSGSIVFDFGSRDMNIFNDSIYTFDPNGTKPTPDEFTVADGQTNSTTVYLLVEVTVFDSDFNTLGSTQQELSFTVTHTNAAANTSMQGSVDAGASG